MNPDQEFLKKLRATFRVEASDHVQTIGKGLVALEKAPEGDARRGLVAEIFRAAHSLKGAARAVDFGEIETLCQSVEDVFAGWRRGGEISAAALDEAHATVNRIEASMTGSVEAAGGAGPDVDVSGGGRVPGSHAAAGDTVRVEASKLDARLVEAEEMLTLKLAAAQRAEELRELALDIESWRGEHTTAEPHVRALREALERSAADGRAVEPGMTRLLGFLEWSRGHVRALEAKASRMARAAIQDRRSAGRLVDELLDDSKRLLLLPFSTVSGAFPKLVRDLCREQDKEADVVIEGEEVQLDKRILEEMKDPLVHILRNCVDHGVERPEERRKKGKPPRATIRIRARPVNGSKVELVVSDDGAGIDIGRVKASAVRHGAIGEAEAASMTERDALNLIFRAEVSTSPLITRVSGRGLGLAIVRERASRLGGSAEARSEPGSGTSFHIQLPSLLATFRGLQVEAAGRAFVFPLTHVERVGRVKAGDIRSVEGREAVSVEGRPLSLARLADLLELPHPAAAAPEPDHLPFLVVASADERLAVVVDAVTGEEEVLVKPLRKPLVRVRNIAGATVLGSGRVVPILNVGDLVQSARSVVRRAAPEAVSPERAGEAKSLLVAEDSITSRMLIKGMLETAGYRVSTASDGMEALARLRSERFDLLVSDVEMPRLGGLDLTLRIRADRRLAELPVVLVTALETREDRERGVEAGANAYIVKSGLEKDSLIEAVRRLVGPATSRMSGS